MLEDRNEYLRLLSGAGIEIGALHRPSNVPQLKVSYVDRLTRAQALEHYPELSGLNIVEPDIIDDAEELRTVANASQDFVLANHVIEHMANPIKALQNWTRVLRAGGRLFLAVPEKNQTFDREREITPWDHLLLDYRQPSSERDYQHFKDFALYVSCRTFGVRPESDAEAFAKELWDQQYSIHYHVWDYSAFLDFIEKVSSALPNWPMRVISSRESIDQEFIFVLEKQ